MLLLCLLDNFFKRNKYMFVKAITTPEIIIGGVTKVYIEHYVVSFELSLYLIGGNLIMLPYDKQLYTCIIAYNVIMIPTCITMPYLIPGYRLYKSFNNKTLKIINLTL